MSNMTSGPNREPQQQEGISTRAWITTVLVAGIVLFVVFFTWIENTSNLSSNNSDAPVSGTGTSVPSP